MGVRAFEPDQAKAAAAEASFIASETCPRLSTFTCAAKVRAT